MSATETQTVILTDEEIATLNAARTILARATKDAQVSGTFDAFDAGVAYEALTRAENGIFQALNVLNSYSVRPMPDWMVHNYPPPEGDA
jgi:hypothetical protein